MEFGFIFKKFLFFCPRWNIAGEAGVFHLFKVSLKLNDWTIASIFYTPSQRWGSKVLNSILFSSKEVRPTKINNRTKICCWWKPVDIFPMLIISIDASPLLLVQILVFFFGLAHSYSNLLWLIITSSKIFDFRFQPAKLTKKIKVI